MLHTIALLTVLSAAPTPDSIPGTWQIRGDADGNAIEEICTIKRAGNTLTGSCNFRETAFPLTGEVKDATITFSHPAGEYEGNALTIAFTGTLSTANELKGTLTVAPFGVGGAFTATRSAAAP